MSNKQEQRLKALALVLRALGHETRLKILNLLNKNARTLTQMQMELKLNAKLLRDHLRLLCDKDLVKKRENTGFEITHTGIILLEISMKEILEIIELGD